MDMDLGRHELRVDAARQILAAHPEACILMLSGMVDFDMVNDGIEAGIKGYLLKTNAVDELVRAIHTVINSGLPYVVQEMAQLVVTQYKGFLTQGSTPNKTLLTPREREVLKLTADGLRMKDIANQLNIGLKTVGNTSFPFDEKADLRQQRRVVHVAMPFEREHFHRFEPCCKLRRNPEGSQGFAGAHVGGFTG